MKRQPTVAEIIMLAGGAITFLFSFADFVGSDELGSNAWSRDVFALFPNTTIIALFGLATVVVILVTWLANPNLPKVLTFDWKQILFAWGATSLLLMLCYLITDKGEASLKVGGIFMLLGSLAMAVGSTLNLLNIATSPVSGGGGAARSAVAGGFPGQPGGYPGQPGVSRPAGQPGYAPAPPSAPTPPPPPPPASGGSTPPPPPPPI